MSNREARRLLKSVNKKHHMVMAEGYHPSHGRYVIYQWNVYGAIYHANFFYPI